jgi:hypothetical protein
MRMSTGVTNSSLVVAQCRRQTASEGRPGKTIAGSPKDVSAETAASEPGGASTLAINQT